MIPAVAITALIAVGVATAPDDEGEDAARDTATTSIQTSSGADEPTTTQPAATGTREAPLPIGQAAQVGDDYEVTVVGFSPDATAEVRAANQFNEPPGEGEVYALVRVRATYLGDREGTPAFDLSVGYIGADSRVYVDHECGAVRPDSMIDQPSVVAGGTVEGNFCLRLPASVIGTGAIFVEPLFSFSDNKTWWAEQ